ncbi:MAG: hypothetical protein J0H84_26610 [Rhizobiales bacterium]|nr:hypothetical protein [Hyphomicrobiales bacterium]
MHADKSDRAIAGPDVQRAILSHLAKLQMRKVVSSNKAIEAIRNGIPECELSDAQLARLIGEAAICLGFIPVFDPERASDSTLPSGRYVAQRLIHRGY